MGEVLEGVPWELEAGDKCAFIQGLFGNSSGIIKV